MDPHTFSEDIWTLHADINTLPHLLRFGMWIHREINKHYEILRTIRPGHWVRLRFSSASQANHEY